MPESKSRLPHKYSPHRKSSNTHAKTKKTNRASIIVALFVGLLGLGISYFIFGANTTALLLGALIGIVIGAIFGFLVARNLSNK